jgi:uncharacterized membrane-anchored protein
VAIRGIARVDKRTKGLVKRLQPGEIAVIAHRDIDGVAAESLISCGARAVVNGDESITGRYPNPGPLHLLRAGIPVLDKVGTCALEAINDGDIVEIRDNRLWVRGRMVGLGQMLSLDMVAERMALGRKNLQEELRRFTANTLVYAWKEKDAILGRIPLPPIKTSLQGRHALVVVRGAKAKEDLMAIRSYIDEVEPVLIGVDGGSDILVELGYRPHLIVGDMDSVSDTTLTKGGELVVHAYPDGRAPGLRRIQEQGLKAHVLPLPGTSEDVAMLLAYEKGATLIVAVGSHSNMIDFLEKGRRGMASTLLVRLKVGEILVDAKGVSKLYRGRPRIGYVFSLGLAACVPVMILLLVSDSLRQAGRFLLLVLRVMLAR